MNQQYWSSRIQGLVPYTPGEQPKDRTFIKLNTNENPYPPSPKALEAIRAAVGDGLRLYPDPECAELRDAIAEYHGLPSDMVFAGNGSDEILAFCFQAFFDPDRILLFPDVTYSFYPVFAALYGLQYRQVPLDEGFGVPVESFLAPNGGVVLANPNAPTGLCLPLAEIEALLRQDPDRLVVVDEAYVDFGGESAACLLGRYDNLLVVGTFSKSRSLAGARLGYAVGSPALISDLNTVKFSFNPYNINRLTLLAGEAALADAPYFARCCTQVAAVRDETAQALRALGFTVTDSKTNFLFAGAHPAVSGGEYYAALRQSSILVRHFTLPRIENWVRISVGTAAQMQRLVDVTKQILDARHSAAR